MIHHAQPGWRRCLLLLAIALTSLTPSALGELASFSYTLIDLGSFGGTQIRPTDINSSGQIVGYAVGPDGNRHAFLYSGGVLIDLGTQGQLQSAGYSINDSGVLVGAAGGSVLNQAFTYTGGTFTSLPTTLSGVSGINNSGTIVGTTSVSGTDHAAVYASGSVATIDGSAYSSGALAINGAGEIVGVIYPTLGSPAQAFIYNGSSLTLLGSLGGSSSYAYGLNDFGQAVGSSQTAGGSWDGFLWSGGSMVDIGVGLVGHDINNSGFVAGEMGSGGGAILYHNGSTLWLDSAVDIDNSNFASLDGATSINSLGQIVGFGTTWSGDQHAFLLTPTDLTPVPEPRTWALVSTLGLVGLLGWKRFKALRGRHA